MTLSKEEVFASVTLLMRPKISRESHIQSIASSMVAVTTIKLLVIIL